jgi:hypothetical protein
MRTSVALAGLLFLASCAPVPLATSYPATAQYKMQSVEHWQFLAESLADDIAAQFRFRPDLAVRPIFVAQKQRPGFPAAFEDYLTTALVNRQFIIAHNPSWPAMILDYGIRRVVHSPDRIKNPFPGIGTLAGAGIWLGNQGATHWSGSDWAVAAIPAGAVLDALAQIVPTDTEVIITANLLADGQTILREARNFYVPDGEAGLYPNIAVARSQIPLISPPCRPGQIGTAPCQRIVMDP